MTALQKLREANGKGKYICVGLDTDPAKIPDFLKKKENPVLEFNKRIIEATKDLAAAYKINFAFYERDGYNGIRNLKDSLSFISENLLTIADAKRGDIGNTASMYAKSVFEFYGVDSVTVNPYMGGDSVQPFLSQSDKLVFLLALTSNPGSSDFEKLKLDDGSMVYQKVIDKVNEWNVHDNCGIVFGATQSDELRQNMPAIKNLPVLLPGVGAQGGSLEDVVRIFKDAGRDDYLVNVSRGIIYKSNGEDFEEAARNELLKFNEQIKSVKEA